MSAKSVKKQKNRGAKRAKQSNGRTLATAQQLRQSGKLGEAEALLLEALEKKPGEGTLRLELARVRLMQGQLDAAMSAAEQALEQLGEGVESCLVLGSIHYARTEYAKAQTYFQRAVDLNAGSAVAHNNLANALGALGKVDEAIEHSRQALSLRPQYAEGWSNLGILLKDAKQLEEAEKALHKALSMNPRLMEAEQNLVTVLSKQRRFIEARNLAEKLVQRHPDSASAFSSLARIHEELGEAEQAKQANLKATELAPEQPLYFNGFLFALHYDPSLSAEQIHQYYRDCDRRFYKKISDQASPPQPTGGVEKQLRVGFLSSTFRSHPVSFFTYSALQQVSRDSCQLVAFDSGTDPDHVTSLMRATMDEWIDVGHLDDDQLAEAIRKANIDILVDLIGHSSGTRLRAVAQKPAPVVVKWVGGQLGSTGMEVFDWFITDRFESPEGTEHLYTERLYRMPDDYVCYTPPDYAPDVGPLPALDNGFITFACFNKLSKVNDELLATWAKLLDRVEASRLMLKAKPLDDPEVCRLLRDRFARIGGDPDRLILRGWSKHSQLLATYGEVDVALDSWPYSGGLTTCEALWMGVPVISRPGPTFAGRHSMSHLINAGLEDWVVDTPQAYIDKAVSVASDIRHLSQIRQGLRQQVARSPLCDARRFAEHLKQALRFIWSESQHHQQAAITAGPPPLKDNDAMGKQDESSRESTDVELGRIVAQAEALLSQGHVAEAGKICLAAIKAAPQNPDVLCLAGLMNMASGDAGKALPRIEQALEQRPWDVKFNMTATQALKSLGEEDQANALAEVAERLQALRQGDGSEHAVEAMAYLDRGDRQAAMDSLKKGGGKQAEEQDVQFLSAMLGTNLSGPSSGGTGQHNGAKMSTGLTGESDSELPSQVIDVGVKTRDGRALSIAIPKNEVFRLRNIFDDDEYALPKGLETTGLRTVVDVGANVGSFALYAKGWGNDVSVYCFEPNPQVLGLLEQNVKGYEHIQIFPMALSDQDGEITLYQHPANTGQSSVSASSKGSRPVQVPMKRSGTALQAAGLSRIDVLKIDTEGSEVPILAGMKELLERTVIVMLEYHSEADRRKIDQLLPNFQLYSAQVVGLSGVGTLKYLNPRLLGLKHKST